MYDFVIEALHRHALSRKPSFIQNCAFCHGRDAGGGEEGPDLTRSKLVAEDVGGNKIGPVVLNGRQEKGMPRFQLAEQDIKDLVSTGRESARVAILLQAIWLASPHAMRVSNWSKGCSTHGARW